MARKKTAKSPETDDFTSDLIKSLNKDHGSRISNPCEGLGLYGNSAT